MGMEICDYVGVSEVARFYKVTTMTIYNMIREGRIKATQFNRGTMTGWLVEKPHGYDEWYEKEGKKTDKEASGQD